MPGDLADRHAEADSLEQALAGLPPDQVATIRDRAAGYGLVPADLPVSALTG